MSQASNYTEDNIKTLDWRQHMRIRPGMYIGKVGDGSSPDDGIYILLKEILDNSVDEFVMGFGKKVEIELKDRHVSIRDYGRGIPLGKMVDAVSKMNTGGKYDSRAFKKSVGLNGVGTKAVNALSVEFETESFREGEAKKAVFKKGELEAEEPLRATNEPNGTKITFLPDDEIFHNFRYREEYIERLIKNYVYLNTGLSIYLNGKKYFSENGLKDLLEGNINDQLVYPIIHLKDEDIEIALTHSASSYTENYFSFVNGQHTTQGGTHLNAFKEGIVKTFREHFNTNFDASDVRKSITAAISVKVEDPIFESQTKTKLGSTDMGPGLSTIRTFVNDFIKNKLDNFLHKNAKVAEVIKQKIKESENERKALSGIRKLAKERAKKVSLHNKKLRDSRQHYDNQKSERRLETTIFITEGDSASGSITKSRDDETQAVFSLRGKPLNAFGLTKKIVYENEEFNLLQAALNIENGIENLRYNNVVIATDADVDGMHIRLLIITFFLQFFPELIREGHLYILETPLFRVRNKSKTIYCYSDKERISALAELGKSPEITCFKGLGEISPDEFKNFINKDIRLEPVMLDGNTKIEELLTFYMGKNTQQRQNFIIENLVVEENDILNEAV